MRRTFAKLSQMPQSHGMLVPAARRAQPLAQPGATASPRAVCLQALARAGSVAGGICWALGRGKVRIGPCSPYPSRSPSTLTASASSTVQVLATWKGECLHRLSSENQPFNWKKISPRDPREEFLWSLTPSSQSDLLDVQHTESLSPESSWVLIFGASVSPANALPPHRGIVRSQRRLKVVKFQMPGTRDTPRGHNQSREELSKGLQNCLSQDSETNKPSGRSYNSPACHPPPKKTQTKEGFICVVLLCSDMPVCSPFCFSAPDPRHSASIPHSYPLDTGAIQKRHSAKERGRGSRAGGLRGRGPVGQCWGTQVHVGGRSVDQPLWQIISAIGRTISLGDL